MAIITSESRVFRIISGEHRGRTCVIRTDRAGDHVGVVLSDSKSNETTLIRIGRLAELEIPGWPDKIYNRPYGLREYFDGHRGDGSNMLRTAALSQPRAMMKGDFLEGGYEIVGHSPRRGFNSSVLIHLSKTGWVEVASRLPVALVTNKQFKFPDELVVGDVLATGCRVVKNPHTPDVNWTAIFLDREDCEIEVPSCIPLAL